MADKEVVSGEIVERSIDSLSVRDNSTLVALERATIDQQIATAKAYPRSVERFKQDVLSMATLDRETAESMTYQLPRDGKLIEGPSIRLAEIAGTCWGNVRYNAEVIEVGDEFLTAQGRCHDLERNVDIALRVRRRIVNKWGKRFGVDMIATTGQAACSIALRNAIFRVIPFAFLKPVIEKAKHVAAGDEKTLAARRDAAMLWFKERDIKPEWVFALLSTDERKVKGKDDVTLEHIGQLLGIRNAVKDGEAKILDFFEPFITSDHETKKGKKGKKAVTLDDLTGASKSQPAESPSQPAASPEPEPEPETTDAKEDAKEQQPSPAEDDPAVQKAKGLFGD
jgi:hypothetical protein